MNSSKTKLHLLCNQNSKQRAEQQKRNHGLIARAAMSLRSKLAPNSKHAEEQSVKPSLRIPS